jgi:hypothetical protein
MSSQGKFNTSLACCESALNAVPIYNFMLATVLIQEAANSNSLGMWSANFDWRNFALLD